jgi:ComF family protein
MGSDFQTVAPNRVPKVKSLLRNAVDFLYPPFCILCDAPLPPHLCWFCAPCGASLHVAASLRDACPRCAMDRRTSTCACALAWDRPYDAIHSLFTFDDAAQKFIHQIKYQEKRSLAWYMGKTFSRHIPGSFINTIDILLPIPLHYLRKLQRGYNQADHFCRGVADGIARQIPMMTDALRRRRHTRTQTRLNSTQRQKNLAGAFALRPNAAHLLEGRNLLVIDDVLTTGATATECSEVLLKAGANSVRILTLARA